MNGKAPNCPATGSQTEVRQKLRPNARTESQESRVRRIAMAATRTGTRDATAAVPIRKARLSFDVDRDGGAVVIREYPDRLAAYLMFRIASISSFTTLSGSGAVPIRSEEHTSELQSHSDLVCRLL